MARGRLGGPDTSTTTVADPPRARPVSTPIPAVIDHDTDPDHRIPGAESVAPATRPAATRSGTKSKLAWVLAGLVVLGGGAFGTYKGCQHCNGGSGGGGAEGEGASPNLDTNEKGFKREIKVSVSVRVVGDRLEVFNASSSEGGISVAIGEPDANLPSSYTHPGPGVIRALTSQVAITLSRAVDGGVVTARYLLDQPLEGAEGRMIDFDNMKVVLAE